VWPFKSAKKEFWVEDDAPESIRELVGLLQRLKSRDERCNRVFGAARHRYELCQPLRSEQISAFEAEHRISLPTEYRDFIQYAGNGGAGPNYGLVPLQEAVPMDEVPCPRALLSQTFPYTSELLLTQFAPLGEEDPNWEEFFTDRLIGGCIRLAHNGCNNWDILVVTGPSRGMVWSDSRGSNYGLVPQDVGFLDWYRDWLQEALDIARLV
jgi:hypothetical protein